MGRGQGIRRNGGMKRKMLFNADKGVLTNVDLKQAKYKFVYFFLVLFIVIACLAALIPALWMVCSAFKEPAEIVSGKSGFFPKSFDIKKVWNLWTQLKIYETFLNSLILAAGCVVADVLINGFAGYVLSRLKPKGSGFYFAVVSWLMMMPATASLVPNYMLFKKLGMLNTYYPMYLMAATNMFNILLFKSSFDGISISLIESAKIDGASVFRIFARIIVPLSVPVIVTVSLFTFNGQLGNFFWPYLLISVPEKNVMGVRIYQMKNSTLSVDKQMMMLLFSVIPQFTVFLLFQKYIVGGINIGGVKG